MALILNIDTALETASICLAKDGQPLQTATNSSQSEHAAWVHDAIRRLLKACDFTFNDIHAIAVTIGPGSYTGLRVGLATAKGLCYATNLPLIICGTLQMMAYAARNEACDLLCPMIDARRMEVFTAIFDKRLSEVVSPFAFIITPDSFRDELSKNTICFFGNGSGKFQSICKNDNAIFRDLHFDASTIASIAEESFSQKKFADIAYVEPLYLKEFYTKY